MKKWSDITNLDRRGAFRLGRCGNTVGRLPGRRVVVVLVTLLFSILYASQFVAHGKPAPKVPQPATVNTIEDTFTRPNQAGWGTTTNPDGVPNVAWGLDGGGSKSYVTIVANTGLYGYPGSINTIGVASSGSATYNGGDSLVKFAVSAVGHVTPYVVQNACSDKSCYYGARLHTSQHTLELARRASGSTSILASVPFTASATTGYWMRLHVITATARISNTLQAKVWQDGTTEPSTWMVSYTDMSPLGANLVGTGGSWDQTGTGESIQYACYAYASSGVASPCGGAGLVPTATSTPALPTPTTTPTPALPTPTTTPTPMRPTATATPTKTVAEATLWLPDGGC